MKLLRCSVCGHMVDPEGHRWECWMMGGKTNQQMEYERLYHEHLEKSKP
jgi:hypothetical protein